MVAEVARLSEHPGRVGEARDLLRRYLHLPDVWEQLGSPLGEIPDVFAEELERFPGDASPPTGEVLMALARCAVVGLGEVVSMRGDVCEFKRLHVDPGYEGSGIGRLLVEAMLGEARELGYRRVVLDVLASRARARALWASVGFEEIDPYRVYRLPMVFMGRSLDGRAWDPASRPAQGPGVQARHTGGERW